MGIKTFWTREQLIEKITAEVKSNVQENFISDMYELSIFSSEGDVQIKIVDDTYTRDEENNDTE